MTLPQKVGPVILLVIATNELAPTLWTSYYVRIKHTKSLSYSWYLSISSNAYLTIPTLFHH